VEVGKLGSKARVVPMTDLFFAEPRLIPLHVVSNRLTNICLIAKGGKMLIGVENNGKTSFFLKIRFIAPGADDP
jgi:hypothetical protein